LPEEETAIRSGKRQRSPSIAAEADADAVRSPQQKRNRPNLPGERLFLFLSETFDLYIHIVLSDVFKTEKKVPTWAENCVTLFSSKKDLLGDAWATGMSVWAEYEKIRGLQSKRKGFATTSGRPGLVRDWIQRARKPTWAPATSGTAIGESFWTWWHAIQPEWRRGKGGNGRDMVRDGNDWTAVDVNGPNGLSTVMAVLFFWGVDVRSRRDHKGIADWARGLGDVTFVLQKLAG